MVKGELIECVIDPNTYIYFSTTNGVPYPMGPVDGCLITLCGSVKYGTKFRCDQDPPNIVLNLDSINYTVNQFPQPVHIQFFIDFLKT